MVRKTKHSKQLKKAKAKKEAEKKKNEPEIDFDTSAYVIYNRLEMTYPCLSFDIVADTGGDDPSRVDKFPLSLNLIAGAQTPPHVENNYIYVIKVANIKPLKQDTDSEEESDGGDNQDEPEVMPSLTSIRVAHKGCVNRLRTLRREGKVLTASWSDKGKVYIYDLTTPLLGVEDQRSIKTYTAQKVEPKPIYTFGGHLSEGFALDWAPLRSGSLATGDCKKSIHIWTMRNQLEWNVDQQPLVGHENSVEDIKWSPDKPDILASCSVDKSLRLWDLRLQATARCVTKVLDCHSSDVNVIDWNRRSKNLIVSGGDDGIVKVWDDRYLMGSDKPFPVAQFDYHKKPITSVEWNPNDDTVLAVASEDDKLTLWDLAVEKDDEEEDAPMDVEGDKSSSSSSSDESDDDEAEDEEANGKDNGEDDAESNENQDEGVDYKDLKSVPEQMLFLHQGQVEVKELHWHRQLNGLLISTALNGINIFKTISA